MMGPMESRGAAAPATVALLVLCSMVVGGCLTEPTCHQPPTLDQVERKWLDNLGDRLAEGDVRDAQRKQVFALVQATIPRLGPLRAKTQPRARALVSGLRVANPDRVKLTAQIAELVDLYDAYLDGLVPVMLRIHGLLTVEQRRVLARPPEEEEAGWDRSWLFERSIDYFLLRINARKHQRALLMRIKGQMLKRNDAYREQVKAVRDEVRRQFISKSPDPRRITAAMDTGARATKSLLYEAVGYYLYFVSKLSKGQREVMNRELVRFEPCE